MKYVEKEVLLTHNTTWLRFHRVSVLRVQPNFYCLSIEISDKIEEL